MLIFDASSIIYAWDNYPIEQFPGVWNWLGEEITLGNLAMPSVAFEETIKNSKECSEWLESKTVKVISPSNSILQKANLLKASIGVIEDKYHPSGVGENDLMIIANLPDFSSIFQYHVLRRSKSKSLGFDTSHGRKLYEGQWI